MPPYINYADNIQIVLAALPILLRPAVHAYPSTHHSTDNLASRGPSLPSYGITNTVREADPYACAGACSNAKTDINPRSLSSTASSEHELATRAVDKILQRAPSATLLARDLFPRTPKVLAKPKTKTGGDSNAIKPGARSKLQAGAAAAKHYLKSPTNDLGLAGDVLSVLPIPGVEQVGLVMKGASMAAKAEKVGKAAAYARKGVKAAQKVGEGVGKAQDVQSAVQTAQQVAGQVEQSGKGGKSGPGKGKEEKRSGRRGGEGVGFARRGW